MNQPEWLTEMRCAIEKSGLTQRDVARAAELSEQYLCDVLRGRWTHLNLRIAFSVERALDLPSGRAELWLLLDLTERMRNERKVQQAHLNDLCMEAGAER